MNTPKVSMNQIIRAVNGDSAALNGLLSAYQNEIYAIAYSVLKNRADAEDAMQQALIAVWQNIDRLAHPESFESWLYLIVHTRSLNLLRTKKNQREIDGDISELPQLDRIESDLLLPQEYAERSDLRERLFSIIDSLSPVQREAIVLYYFHDMPVSEIAAVTVASEGTVKSRLYLARKSIKTEIEEQERRSGERFFGVSVAVVPLGKLVRASVIRTLPEPAALAALLTAAQTAAFSSASVAAGTAAAAAGGIPLALKILFAVLGVAAIAGAGVAASQFIIHNDDAQPTEAVVAADAAAPSSAAAEVPAADPTESPVPQPTEKPTEAPTEAPTEPPFADAYRAYLQVLEDNETAIRNYDWQYTNDAPKPIAFADIMGDDTPEMVTIQAVGNANASIFGPVIKVYTYNGSAAVEAISYAVPDNTNQMRGQLFLSQIGGELYLFEVSAPGAAKFETAYRFDDNGDHTLSMSEAVRYSPREDIQQFEEGQSRVNGEVVSREAAHESYLSLAKSTDALLLSSSGSGQTESYPRRIGLDSDQYPNHAESFDGATAFLREHIG